MQVTKTFRFTSEHDLRFPYSAPALRDLAAPLLGSMSAQDRSVFDEIVGSLEQRGALPFAWTPQEHLFLAQHDRGSVIPYLLYRFKLRVFPTRQQVADFPAYLLIEPTSACALRCTMCFQTDKSFTKQPFMGAMDFDMYCSVIDQAADGGTRGLTFASRGEPFQNKRLGKMLRYAADKKTFLELKVNTNGTRLNEGACHDVLSSGVSILVVSIDSSDPEEYSRIRVGGDFSTVLANVRALREIRDRHYADSKTELRVSGVKISPEQDETRFNAFWSEIADTVTMIDAEKRWNTYESPIQEDIKSPCGYLWERMYVWFDGTCNPCDLDYKSYLHVGNVKTSSVRDIWHGETYSKIRDHHMRGARAEYVPCDRCGVA